MIYSPVKNDAAPVRLWKTHATAAVSRRSLLRAAALISILNAARAEALPSRHYRTPISIPSSETCCEKPRIHYQGDMFSTPETSSLRPLPPRVRPLSRRSAVRFFFLLLFVSLPASCPVGCQTQPLQMIRAVKVNSIARGGKHLSRRFRRKCSPVRCKL